VVQATTPNNEPVYGEKAELDRLQQAMPAPQAAPPGARGGLLRPSERPDEPVTAGLDAAMSLEPLDLLRVMYRQYPNEDLRRAIERFERAG